jgi:hypothetical protein
MWTCLYFTFLVNAYLWKWADLMSIVYFVAGGKGFEHMLQGRKVHRKLDLATTIHKIFNLACVQINCLGVLFAIDIDATDTLHLLTFGSILWQFDGSSCTTGCCDTSSYQHY